MFRQLKIISAALRQSSGWPPFTVPQRSLLNASALREYCSSNTTNTSYPIDDQQNIFSKNMQNEILKIRTLVGYTRLLFTQKNNYF